MPEQRLGATVIASPAGRRSRFEVWAPEAATVTLELTTPIVATRPMAPTAKGYWVAETDEADGIGHGATYRFRVDGAEPLPDPASRWQPDGVHGASAVVDTAGFGGATTWTDDGWRGVALHDAVVYELHVGTFTSGGTLEAAISELDRLRDLGVTVVELMPVNAFPGDRNWGYDGVFPFAVQETYGGPVGLARFVDAAHARGAAVILDVVYNHAGPEGNVLPRFGPYFSPTATTPWGPSLNVAGEGSDEVRRFVLENVRHWIRHYHLDGLRLDAVHEVVDPTANPIWEQVATAAHEAGGRRRVLVVAESSDNDPRLVRPPDRGGYGHDAVWNDDFHHSLHVAVTGEHQDYYADYDGGARELGAILEHRWLFRGQYSSARGRSHGRPVDDAAPAHFVVCAQNHDQVGNRPAGDRPALTPAKRRFMPAAIVLSPFTPLLFMGEEYGETAPFPFFVDHRDHTVLEATRAGRREEFADADWSVDVPDPADPATFAAAVLDPGLAAAEPHRSLLAMYTELLRLRRDVAAITSPTARQQVRCDGPLVIVERRDATAVAELVLNVSGEPASTELTAAATVVAFDSSDARWGGEGGGVVLAGSRVAVAPWTAGLIVG